MLVRAGFDVDTVMREDVGGAQYVLALVGRIGDMMQAPYPAAVFFGAGKIMGLVVHREPAAAQAAVIQLDFLGHSRSKAGSHEAAELGHVRGQEVQVIQPSGCSTRKGTCGGLQGVNLSPLWKKCHRIVLDFKDMEEWATQADELKLAN
jgi:hypothetical protein